MKLCLSAFLLLTINLCFAQNRLDSLITRLQNPNYGQVRTVKDSIINYQKEAIPKLIELLKDTNFVKLKNTADLIYPGAEKFYGHGGIIYYDIDWISIRAAWILEEITFHDFGYRNLNITEEKLMTLHIQNYGSYLESGSHEIDLKDKTPRQQGILYRSMLADSVSEWWLTTNTKWTRYNALKEALESIDEQEQDLAIQFLRFGDTKCEALTIENYKKDIKPLLENIVLSKNSNSEQAKYVLDDEEYYWFESKQ